MRSNHILDPDRGKTSKLFLKKCYIDVLKLYEEKLMKEEGLRKTDNNLIHIGCPIPFDTDSFLQGMSTLMTAAYRNDKDIRARVADMVQTYHPANPEVTIIKDAKYVALV